MNLTALRDAVRERCGVLATDQLGLDANLTGLVNAALHWVERKNPKGWSWLNALGVYAATGGAYAIPFVTLWPSVTIVKVRDIRYTASGIWGPALGRVTYQDALDLYPDTVTQSTPEVYAVLGTSVYIRPTPITGTTFLPIGIRTEPDLSGGTDSPLMPAIHHDIIVERASSLLMRRMRNFTEAAEATKAADAGVLDMRRHDNPYVGPGMAQLDTSAGALI